MAKAEGISVKMQDGRTVKFGTRQKLNKEVLFNSQGNATGVRFDLANGESFALDLAKVPDPIKLHMMAHGGSQKVGDECAALDNTSDMAEAVREMIARLYGGQWKAEREGFSGQSVLVEALVKVTGQARDKVREILKGLTGKEKAALKQDPEIKRAIDEIEAQRVSGVDRDEVLRKFQA